MARTSKTKIGDSGESNDRMMRAASSGADAVARGHAQLLRQHQVGQEQAMQTAEFANKAVGQGLERDENSRQFNEKMAQDESQFARGREDQNRQFSEKMAQDESQFSRGLGQRQSETELEAAKAGFEPGEDPQARDSRAAQLEAEMRKGQGQPQIGPLEPEAQERLNEQVKSKMEMDAHGKWRPTQERSANIEREQKRRDFEADTDRIKAIEYRNQVAAQAQKALRSGDQDAYEEHAQILANLPNDQQKMFDRFMTNKSSESDWSDIAKMTEGIEAHDPSLAADIKAQSFTPRVAAALKAAIGKNSLEAIVGSMGDSQKLKVDWTNPAMEQFRKQVMTEAMFLRANPSFGEFAKIQSTEDKMRFLNVISAAKVLMGMGSAPMGKGSGGMVPAMGAPGAAGGAPGGGGGQMLPPGSTQVPGRAEGAAAVRGARAGGATPSEALQAGQKANPTNPANEPVRPQTWRGPM